MAAASAPVDMDPEILASIAVTSGLTTTTLLDSKHSNKKTRDAITADRASVSAASDDIRGLKRDVFGLAPANAAASGVATVDAPKQTQKQQRQRPALVEVVDLTAAGAAALEPIKKKRRAVAKPDKHMRALGMTGGGGGRRRFRKSGGTKKKPRTEPTSATRPAKAKVKSKAKAGDATESDSSSSESEDEDEEENDSDEELRKAIEAEEKSFEAEQKRVLANERRRKQRAEKRKKAAEFEADVSKSEAKARAATASESTTKKEKKKASPSPSPTEIIRGKSGKAKIVRTDASVPKRVEAEAAHKHSVVQWDNPMRPLLAKYTATLLDPSVTFRLGADDLPQAQKLDVLCENIQLLGGDLFAMGHTAGHALRRGSANSLGRFPAEMRANMLYRMEHIMEDLQVYYDRLNAIEFAWGVNRYIAVKREDDPKRPSSVPPATLPTPSPLLPPPSLGTEMLIKAAVEAKAVAKADSVPPPLPPPPPVVTTALATAAAAAVAISATAAAETATVPTATPISVIAAAESLQTLSSTPVSSLTLSQATAAGLEAFSALADVEIS